MFEDVHPQYTVGLVSIRKGERFAGSVALSGPFANYASYLAALRKLSRAEFTAADLMSWSTGASFPMLPSARSAEVFLKLRAHPRLDSKEFSWRARPMREFDATNDKHLFQLNARDTRGLWPVYKGASFNHWTPDTGDYYGWADPAKVTRVLQEKRLRQQRLARSAFHEFPQEHIKDPETLPCLYPRVAYRQGSRATDSRTVIAALIPGDVVVTNAAPYLLWPVGDARDQAYILGVLSSMPLDWYARRVVEVNVNYHIFNALPIPNADRGSFLRQRIEQIAGCLSAVDDRFEEWAQAVGVAVGVIDENAKEELVAELDAAVALLYGLNADDLRHVFETFHTGWDHSSRLNSVLKFYRSFEVKAAEGA